MKYSVATLIAAAGLVAANSNLTYVTETVSSFVTYCPAPTTITHGSKTYTVTEATTLTITDCPCTITKPVIVTSSVACNTCTAYTNSTGNPVPTHGAIVTSQAPGSPGGPAPTKGGPTPVPTAGAAKVAGLSGLAGLAGLAAYLL